LMKQADLQKYALRSTNITWPKFCLKNKNQPNMHKKMTTKYVGKMQRSCGLNKTPCAWNTRNPPTFLVDHPISQYSLDISHLDSHYCRSNIYLSSFILYLYTDLVFLVLLIYLYVLTFPHPWLYWINGNKDDDDDDENYNSFQCRLWVKAVFLCWYCTGN
jgi:hypothetical protein